MKMDYLKKLKIKGNKSQGKNKLKKLIKMNYSKQNNGCSKYVNKTYNLKCFKIKQAKFL